MVYFDLYEPDFSKKYLNLLLLRPKCNKRNLVVLWMLRLGFVVFTRVLGWNNNKENLTSGCQLELGTKWLSVFYRLTYTWRWHTFGNPQNSLKFQTFYWAIKVVKFILGIQKPTPVIPTSWGQPQNRIQITCSRWSQLEPAGNITIWYADHVLKQTKLKHKSIYS